MTLLIRDSEDILRENIEFHLSQGVDFFIAMDNLSIDSSPAILKEYEQKGLLHYIHQPNEGFHQAKWVTQMARLAAKKYNADWVINNDADEFWWPGDSSLSLKTMLLNLPKDINLIRCERKNFVLPDNKTEIEKPSTEQENPSYKPFYQEMIYKDQNSTNTLGESLPPKIAHRASRWISVGPGNHNAKKFWGNKQADVNIEIFHFPFRSVDQVMEKIRVCSETLMYSDESRKTCSTWKSWGERLNTDQKQLEFAEGITYSDLKIERGLLDGSLIEDTRLNTYLMKLPAFQKAT